MAQDTTTAPENAKPAASPGVTANSSTNDLPPLNWSRRWNEYFGSILGPGAVFQTVSIAGIDHVTKFPKEWGRSGMGFAKRVGSEYGQLFLSESIALGISAIHHEDNRYVRSGQGNFFKRFGRVAKSTVVVNDTRGGQTLAAGQIAGSFGSWAIATKVWEPPSQQSTKQIMLWGGVGLLGTGASNLWHEFWPDVKRKLFTRTKSTASTQPAHSHFLP